jgi:hypothetical protein
MTGPAGDFAGTGAVAATGDSGNNVNANTTGPNSLTEPAMFISLKIGFYTTNPRGIIPFMFLSRKNLSFQNRADSQIETRIT